MKKGNFLLNCILTVVLSLVSVAAWAEETAANRDPENTFIQGIGQMPVAHTFLTEKPAGSHGQKLFSAHVCNKSVMPEATVVDIPSSISCFGHTKLLQRAAGFTQHFFSLNPMIAGGNHNYLLDIFTFIGLNTLLSSHSTVTGNISGSKILYDLLKMPGAFDIGDDSRLTPDHFAHYDRNGEEPAALTSYNDPTLKPFIHNPFHDTAISIYLPISVSRSLTIAPALTYAFSTNNTNNQEFKGKGLVNNLIEKDSAIIYGGIHLKYSF